MGHAEGEDQGAVGRDQRRRMGGLHGHQWRPVRCGQNVADFRGGCFRAGVRPGSPVERHPDLDREDDDGQVALADGQRQRRFR